MRERARCLWSGLIPAAAVLVLVLTAAGASPPLLERRELPHGPASGAAPSESARTAAALSPSTTLSRIQDQLASRRRRLAEVLRREQRALAQFSGAQERLERALVQLGRTRRSLAGTRQAVLKVSRTLEAITARLSTHEELMGDRFRAFYEQGPLGYMDVLLGAAGFRDLMTRSYLVARIVESDLALYHRVARERHQRDEVRATLVARREQLSAEQDRWSASRAETARLAVERRRLLDRVRAERRSQEAAIRELEAESARIMAIIRGARGGRHLGPILTLRTGLLWPVSGRISSGYGWRTHPIFHTREFHTGIDIAVPYGTPIQAALDGDVLFDGWMRGYGRLVILDHGNGLSTTYSHLSAALVHAGQRVKRGDVIARIGSTGWSTGPHLFFEVRMDGQPVNPLGD